MTLEPPLHTSTWWKFVPVRRKKKQSSKRKIMSSPSIKFEVQRYHLDVVCKYVLQICNSGMGVCVVVSAYRVDMCFCSVGSCSLPRSLPSSRAHVCRPQSNPMALGWPSLSRATVHGCRLQLSSAKVLLLGDARFRVYNTSLDSPRPCPLR